MKHPPHPHILHPAYFRPALGLPCVTKNIIPSAVRNPNAMRRAYEKGEPDFRVGQQKLNCYRRLMSGESRLSERSPILTRHGRHVPRSYLQDDLPDPQSPYTLPKHTTILQV